MNMEANKTAVPSEAGALARPMVAGFARLVENYKRHLQLPHDEAVKRASNSEAEDEQILLDRALQCSPDQVSWSDLNRIARSDEERAIARWEEIKREALNELQTGHRAAVCVEPLDHGPWQRAEFLALRTELAAEWQPRNGVERQLVDVMAQAQASYLFWLQALTNRATLDTVFDMRRQKEQGMWQPPRQSDADALEQAAGMVDRFNRILLRTLRTLRDLRRQSSPVILQNGGQLNVAQQQVNVTAQTQVP